MPCNAFFKAQNFDVFMACPKEDLHQFFIGLYGDHIIPATLYEITQVFRKPELIIGRSCKGNPRYTITNKMMARVWKRVSSRLASIHAPTSMLEVTPAYAAHFYDMYMNKHAGKHLTGDRMKILMLNLPFILRDIITPEVSLCIECCISY
jgi:hypothetical protein